MNWRIPRLADTFTEYGDRRARGGDGNRESEAAAILQGEAANQLVPRMEVRGGGVGWKSEAQARVRGSRWRRGGIGGGGNGAVDQTVEGQLLHLIETRPCQVRRCVVCV